MMMTAVMPDANVLANVMEDICPGGDNYINKTVFHQFYEALLHPSRDHGARKTKQDGALLILNHGRPYVQRCSQLLPLKTSHFHLFKKPGKVIHRLH